MWCTTNGLRTAKSCAYQGVILALFELLQTLLLALLLLASFKSDLRGGRNTLLIPS